MSRDRNRRIWRDWFALYGSTAVGQLVSGARSIVVASLLGPQQFGLWKSLQLLLAYSAWTDGGAARGLAREVPLLRGEGQPAERADVERAAWLLTLLPTAWVTFGVVLAGASVGGALGAGLIAFGPVLFTSRVALFLFEVATANKAFGLRSRGVLALAVIDAAVAPPAAWWGGVEWFMASVALTNAVAIVYLSVGLRFSWRLSWKAAGIGRVVAVGFPIAVSGLIFGLTKTTDRLVIAAHMGTEAVGFYGLASIVFDLGVMVPVLLGQVLLPHAVERYGRERDPEALFEQARHLMRTVGRMLPFLLAAGWLLIPAVTRTLLPAYEPGIGAARILIWAPVFLAVHAVGFVVLVALRRLTVLIALHAGALLLAVASTVGAIRLGGGITGVAAAMVITYAVTASVEYVISGWLCGRRPAALCAALAGTLAPAALAAGVALAWEGYLLPGLDGTWSLVASATGIAALGAALCVRRARTGDGSRRDRASTASGTDSALIDGVRDMLRPPAGAEAQDNVEGADWRFLLPFHAGARVLLLGGADVRALALTAPHELLVVDAQVESTGRLPATGPVHLDAERLPFRDGSFDIASVELGNDAELGTLLPQAAEVARVLRRGGVLHVAVPRWNGQSAAGRSQWAVARQAVGGIAGAGGRLARLQRALEGAGFGRLEWYARLPAHGQPRYLLRCDHRQGLHYVLREIPTFSRAGRVIALCLGLAWARMLRAVVPGVSIVAYEVRR